MSSDDLPIEKFPLDASLGPPSDDPRLIEGIPRHLEPIFGKVGGVYHETTSEIIHLDVFQFDPTSKFGNAHTFVTGGMAAKPMNVPTQIQNPERYRFAELLVHLPESWPAHWDELQKPENFWPIAVLKSFARLPHERESWVRGGHSLINGDFEPYTPGTNLCLAMLCPSDQLPDGFGTLSLEDGRELIFWTLAFLYREEMEFAATKGFDRLMERVLASGLSPMDFFVLDPHRASLCR